MENYISPNTALVVESRNGLYTAEFLHQPTDWMIGKIQGRQFENDEQRYEVARAVIDSLEEVSKSEMQFSSCTDGRGRISLADGSTIPVREQSVGADAMELFIMCEALGPRFYKDPTAPVDVRFKEVIDFAKKHGIKLSTHIKCGAALGFLDVIENASRFVEDSDYTQRQQKLIGPKLYDIATHKDVAFGHKRRIDAGLYTGYSAELVTNLILEEVGPHAVEKYLDDGRGVGGHMEKIIARLAKNIRGLAINQNLLAAKYDLQVFGVNAGRIYDQARLFGLGGKNDPDFKTALIAAEDFASAGHGTLATGMETMVISKVA